MLEVEQKLKKTVRHTEPVIPPLLKPLVEESIPDILHMEARGFNMEAAVEWKLYFKWMVAISDRGEELNIGLDVLGELKLFGDRFSMSLPSSALEAYQWHQAEQELLR